MQRNTLETYQFKEYIRVRFPVNTCFTAVYLSVICGLVFVTGFILKQ